ncbi:S41 family peptidase [Pedobacter sp. Hv1]|uniref:S41 family peptidase n=1 Tax=Pedobacter sp. Hv1 TaxID=1740090 RepID=UPI0006D8B7E4|nr:S41 family peptidase [Pedobacter sp. Hv1]KQC02149.1 hypothetical protein AQF98_00820 [Pedobacter sp. Hv1]
MKLKHTTLTLIVLAVTALSACKSKNPTPDPPTPPTNTSRADLSRDSIFLYAKQIYYWNTALPTYENFNPRRFNTLTKDFDNYEKELVALANSAINPATGIGYESVSNNTDTKYSYIFDKANKNAVAYVPNATSSVDLEGNGSDVGVRIGFYGTTASYIIYMTAVYENSPAAKAGLVRGDRITKVNGVAYGTDYTLEKALTVADAMDKSVSIEGIKGSDGSTFTLSLTKTSYKSSPIYKSKIIPAGAKKIGYLAYARFSSAANSNTELTNIFNDFATNGVTDLVIDLRYNGGGYVNTAEYLINLIVPASKASGTMFTEYYNATMQAGGATILAKQPLLDADGKVRYNNGRMLTYADVSYSVADNTTLFSKRGSLNNVQNVVFLVSGSTASASELVINSLKPQMNVKLVGTKTYGKPIGFFPITIENKYDVYYSLFETKNSLNQGGYYDGMIPDNVLSEVPTGTVMYNFGDTNDFYLKTAVNMLQPGTITTGTSTLNKTMSAKVLSTLNVNTANVLNPDLINKEFVGMIDTKHTIKK